MGTAAIDSIWVLGLISKCNNHVSTTLTLVTYLLLIIWLTMSFLYWAQPGGPAWGKYRLTHTHNSNIINGPKGWPIIGSFNLMTGLSHRKIAKEAHRLGAKRLMAFSLGDTRVIVTCHPDPAKQLLNSPHFADRPIKDSAYSLMFNRAIGFAPYGVYWRTLRRLASNHLFSPNQIRASHSQRESISMEMVEVFAARAQKQEEGVLFEVRDVLRWASLSNMMGSVFGKRYSLINNSEKPNQEVMELRKMVEEGYELLGILNWGDHLSWLSEFDLQNIRFRCSKLVPKVNRFIGRIIEEHRSKCKTVHHHRHQYYENRDFVDVLLSLEGSDQLSHSDMIAVLWEMIFRGTDTVGVLIEWILARLVVDQQVQDKVHQELDKVVGRSREVSELDIKSLVYLTAVIKEVVRLHPPGPLLSWSRLAIQDTTIDGYHVPAGTTAMVDMWSISRDPAFWSQPDSFNPDRFLTADMVMDHHHHDFSNILGSDLRLAPFGSGRRSCPGKALGLTTVTFWVASLLHEFHWTTTSTSSPDLSELLKLSCEMAHPLTVQLRRRRTLH